MPEKPADTHKILEEARTVSDETRKAHEEGLFQELEQRVFQPLFDVDYQTETQDIAQGDNQMSFTKTELNKHNRERLAHYIASRSRDITEKGDFSDESSWYAADRLVYKIGETNLDIFSYLPDGYKILFCPNSKVYNGAVDYENKLYTSPVMLPRLAVLQQFYMK